MDLSAPEIISGESANHRRQAGASGYAAPSLSEKTEGSVKERQDRFILQTFVENGRQCDTATARLRIAEDAEAVTTVAIDSTRQMLDALQQVALPSIVVDMLRMVPGQIGKFLMVRPEISMFCYFRCSGRDYYKEKSREDGEIIFASDRGSYFTVEECCRVDRKQALQQFLQGGRLLISSGVVPLVAFKSEMTDFDEYSCEFMQLVPVFEVVIGGRFVELDFFWLDPHHVILRGGILCKCRNRMTLCSSSIFPYPHEEDYPEECCDCGRIHTDPWEQTREVVLTNEMLKEVSGHEVDLRKAPSHRRYGNDFVFKSCHPIVKLYEDLVRRLPNINGVIESFLIFENDDGAIFSSEVAELQGNNVIMGNTSTCTVCATNFADGICRCGMARRVSVASVESAEELVKLRIRWNPDDDMIHHDDKYGAKWNLEHISTSNGKVLGFFSYFSFGEVLPLIVLAKQDKKAVFGRYLDHLLSKSSKRMRIRNIERELFMFLRVDPSFEKYLLAPGFVNEIEYSKVVAFVGALESIFSSLTVPHDVVMVQGPPMLPAFAPISRMKRLMAMREFEGLPMDGAYKRSQMLESSLPTKYGVDAANEMREFFKERCILSARRLGETIIALDAIYYFFRHKDYIRMFAQLLLLFTKHDSLYESARTIYNSSVRSLGLKEWVANANRDLFTIAELEEEQDSDVDSVQGPNLVLHSAIWRKLAALVAASTVPEFLWVVPNFMKKAILGFEAITLAASSHASFGHALVSFGRTFVERVSVFMETWDYRDLLAEHDHDSLIVRGGQLLTMSVVNNTGTGLYFPSPILAVEACEKWLKECDEIRHCSLSLVSKKVPPALDHIYAKVLQKRNGLDAAIKSSRPRDKEPMSYWFAGFPGTGKTEMVNDINRFVVQFDERRAAGEDGLRPVLVNDVGTVSFDQKYWLGVVDPTVIHFNDMKGSGYVNNGNAVVVPDVLRMAVDICPFPTPQASLEAKDNSYIDPAVAVVSSNDSYYQFSVFGNNWKKLPRRYRNVYFFAFPPEYHIDSRDHINQYAGTFPPLKPEYDELTIKDVDLNKMRYYRCSWNTDQVQNLGDLSLIIREKVAVGYHNFLKVVKRDYLDYSKLEQRFVDKKKVCIRWTPFEAHDGETPCMDGCDIVERLRPSVAMVDSKDHGDLLPSGEQPQEVQGPVCSKTTNVIEVVADRVIDAGIARSEARLRRRFDMFKSWIYEYRYHAAGLVSGLVAAGIVYSLIRSEKTEVETFSSSIVTPIQGAVVNPTTLDTDSALMQRYGMQEAKAREMDQPPQYPVNERVHVFLSASSKTSAFDDINKLAVTNWRRFRGATGEEGYGLFLDSTTLYMQNHVYKALTGPLTLLPPPGYSEDSNYMRLVVDCSRAVCENDDVLIRVPPFPVSSIWKHIADSTGALANVSVGGSGPVLAKKTVVDLRPFHIEGANQVFKYPVSLQKGDCGTPVVANINGSGIILGVHLVRFKDGESGCSIFDVNQLKRLASHLPGRCVDMHFEKIAEVQGLSSVSKFRSARGVSMEVLGTFEKCNKQAKSDIRPTRLNPVAVANLSKPMVIPDLPTHGVRIGDVWYSPSVHKFKGMALPYKWSRSELERAIKDYLEGMPTAKLAPLPIHQQLNGVEGDPLIKGMNLKTSAGVYQRFYPDKSFLMSRVEMNSEFKNRVSRVMQTAGDIIRVEHQKWCLKDELIALEKALVSKFRFFMASDPENLFLSRCFGGPVVAHMYEHKEFFEAYGAFNPASPEFGKLMDRHRKFANLLMADLKHMDSSHRSFMSEAVADVFREIATRCGYNEDAANALWNLVASAVLSLIELSGDLAYCNEGMGSGIFFTFIFNCVVLSLMYRVAWFRLSDEPFRKHNALTCGGDDSACTTDNSSFTGVFLKEVFSEYGYELTPPTAKDGNMAEFFPWDEFVFLKRSPITLTVMGKKVEVGALAKDSIWKSLGWDMPSKDVSHEDRMAQVLDAGQREMALHGRAAFDDFQKQVGSTYYYRKLSYEEILAKYVAGKFYDDILNAKCDDSSQVESICSGAKGNFGTTDRDHSASQAKITSGEAVISKIGEAASSVPLFSGLSEHLAAPFPNGWRTNGRDTNVNYITDYFNSKTQSVVSNEITTFNLVAGFSSGAVPEKYPADFANPLGAISIGSILERPVSIGSFTWDSATAFSVSATNILANWRANPTVTAYLRNYKKFRGRPIMRIVSTGNPRWYGKLVVSCDIRPGNDGYSRTLDMSIPSTDLGHVSQILQMPHISIDASAPAMYEVEFPWVAPSGWYDQHQTTRQPAYNIVVAPCCALSSADGVAVGALEYEVFVYMKDLELAVPCAIAVQGPGKGDSELAEGGSLSSKLTAGASFASAATMVPQLAPFAAPMSMALGAAAGVAKSMGYAAPPILETTAPTLDKVTPSLSLMSGRTHVERLVADPKQGVSITADAAGCGNNGDMEIGNIIRRPGLIAQLSWSPSTGTITNNTIPVGVSNNFSSGGWTYRSPLGYVAQAFRYWTGSIKFRFEVVASPYHRGSFVVMYVPHDSFSFPNVNTILNEFQNWVVDLSGSRVVEFTIPYTKEEPYTEFASINGNLYVLQLNALQNMGGTNAITINVYHSAGDDMDFQRPCQAYGNIGCIALDSLQGPGENSDSVDNFGNEESEIAGGGTSSIVATTAPSRTLIYWGESFSNLKEICSRAQPFYVGSLPWPAANSQTAMYRMWHTLRPTCAQLKRVPAVAGTYGPKNAAMLTVGSAYFEPMFLAVRGGYRFGFNRRFYGTIPDSNAVRIASVANCSTVSVHLGSTAYSTYQMDGSIAGATVTYSNNADRLLVLEEGAGVFIDSVQNHPLVYYEVPYTSKFRFRNSRKLLNWMLQSTTGSEEGVTLTMFPMSPFAAEQFVLYSSVADDWSVHCFYCVPRTRSPVNPIS